MARYTTQIQTILMNEIIEHNIDCYMFDWNEVIDKGRPFIFDFPYNMDPKHKPDFETLFLQTYYTWEIGYETVSLFKMKLNLKLKELMPTYRTLYELFDTKKLEDLIANTQTTRTQNANSDTNHTNNSTTDSKYSDFPSQDLTTFENDQFLSNASRDTITGGGNDSTKSDASETVQGLTGKSLLDAVEKFKSETFNIDKRLVAELGSLFMGVMDEY